MSVGIKVGNIIDEIGTPDFFYSFFCSICGNLEPNGWGSKFPTIMNKLYQGNVESAQAQNALNELYQIQSELTLIPPENVIWDIENKSKQPPWGNNISPEITSMANYYVTSAGRDLISTLIEAFDDAVSNNQPATITDC